VRGCFRRRCGAPSGGARGVRLGGGLAHVRGGSTTGPLGGGSTTGPLGGGQGAHSAVAHGPFGRWRGDPSVGVRELVHWRPGPYTMED
jgi:hypothetical protein